MNPIGKIKAKNTVYCTVCNDSLIRNMSVNVFENTPEAIEVAKTELTLKLNNEYTCRICKSILKTNS